MSCYGHDYKSTYSLHLAEKYALNLVVSCVLTLHLLLCRAGCHSAVVAQMVWHLL